MDERPAPPRGPGPGSPRRAHTTLALVITVALAFLGGSAVHWERPCTTQCAGSHPGGTGGALVAQRADSAVRIRGRAVDLLEPGQAAPVDLVLVNGNHFAVTVRRFTVTIGQVRGPGPRPRTGCNAGDFTVVQAPARLAVRVAPRSSTSLSRSQAPRAQWPRVAMKDLSVSQDDCRGVVVELRFESSVRQAR